MKKDTSNQSIIDLDLHFKSLEPSKIITESKYNKQTLLESKEDIAINYEDILREWSYRCDSGSPVYGNTKDMIHLQNILDENNIPLPFDRISEAPADHSITDDYAMLYGLLPKDKKIKFDLFISTMPNNLLIEFKQMTKRLKLAEAKILAKFFKSLKSVNELNGVEYLPYMNLWETYVGQAIGKGELFISFAVDKAVVQGSSQSFDIDDAGRHYEVKSLDVLDSKSGRYKYGQIRPGAEGKVSKYLFTKQIMDFYALIRELQQDAIRDSIMTLGKADAIQKIYTVIDAVSTVKPKGGDVLEAPGDIPASMLDNVYNNVLKLHQIKTLPLNKDVTTSRIAVKGSRKDASYWISPEDAAEITSAAGKNKNVVIKVGKPVDDESKEGKLLLADLFNHPFVKDPKSFTDGLYDIKKAFFGAKAGLIYFLNGKTLVSPDMSEFATTESSQDGYRFGLKSRNKGKAYIENQK